MLAVELLSIALLDIIILPMQRRRVQLVPLVRGAWMPRSSVIHALIVSQAFLSLRRVHLTHLVYALSAKLELTVIHLMLFPVQAAKATLGADPGQQNA